MSMPALLTALLLGAGLLLGSSPTPAIAAEARLPPSSVIVRNGISGDGAIVATVDTQASGPCWTARLFESRGNTWTSLAEGAGPARPSQGNCSPVSAAFSADGKTLAVHAVWDDIVYVFDREATRLVQTAIKLAGKRGSPFPPPTSTLALSADGDTMLVGAANLDCAFAVPQDACGTAFLYGRGARGWSNLAAFPRPVGAGIVQRFGESIAMDAAARVIAIGGTGLLGQPGTIYLYHAVEGAMELVAELRPEAADSEFGTDLAMSDDGRLLAVGGDQRAYLYAREGDKWRSPIIVDEIDDRIGTYGGAVALSGDGRWLFVGAPRSRCKDKGPPRCGLLFRYPVSRDGKAASVGEAASIEPATPQPLSDFGWRIAADQRGRSMVAQGQLAHIFGP